MALFKDLPPHSRIWIYQSAREFIPTEVEQIKALSERFIDEWTSHNQKMTAGIEIFHNLFIVIGVDEKTAPASGCGIDKSVKFIQFLEKEFATSLLDRMNIAYIKKAETNPTIFTCTISELKNRFPSEESFREVFIFNNLIATKEEFEKNWEVPIKNSWHKQFLT